MDDYLTRVGQNPLLKEQGLHDLRQELLEAALGYYREFLRQRSDDPKLRVETAAAHERVGDIMIELGRFDDALAAYDQALALIEQLVREQPGDPTVTTAQVRLYGSRVRALREGGRVPEAIASFYTARSLGDLLLTTGGGTEDLPEILARIYRNGVRVIVDAGGTDEGLEVAKRALAFVENFARDHPDDLSASTHATPDRVPGDRVAGDERSR